MSRNPDLTLFIHTRSKVPEKFPLARFVVIVVHFGRKFMKGCAASAVESFGSRRERMFFLKR